MKEVKPFTYLLNELRNGKTQDELINQDDGTILFQYEEEAVNKAGKKGDLEVPKMLTLGLEVYEQTGAYKVTARLRFRITNDVVQFMYLLDNPDKVLEAAFEDVLRNVEEKSGYKAMRGTFS